jgi:hypothetical protein
MICDFCHGPDPVWRFRAQPFVVDYGIGLQSASDADWAACDACREFIVAGDRAALLERAMQVAPRIPGASECEVRRLRSWAHSLFFHHQLPGQPLRIHP